MKNYLKEPLEVAGINFTFLPLLTLKHLKKLKNNTGFTLYDVLDPSGTLIDEVNIWDVLYFVTSISETMDYEDFNNKLNNIPVKDLVVKHNGKEVDMLFTDVVKVFVLKQLDDKVIATISNTLVEDESENTANFIKLLKM